MRILLACLAAALMTGAASSLAQTETPPLASAILAINQDRLYNESAWGKRAAQHLADISASLAAENRELEANLVAEERALTDARPTMDPEAFRKAADAFDARVVEYASSRMEVLEVSLGDYVLNGGEVAALAVTEAVVRLLPGVLGNPASLVEESHGTDLDGLLEYPVYTKPALWRGLEVPPVLLSGHHGEVAKWRLEQSRRRTAERRPDLLDGRN